MKKISAVFRLNPIFLILIAAVFFYLASPNIFSFYGYPVFAWIFAVPLFYALDRKPVRIRLIYGVFFGLSAYGMILGWVSNVNVFLFTFFAALFALQPVLFSGILKPDRRNMINIFFLPAVWVLTEAARSFLIGGFSWTIGHSQVFNPHLIQIADITGPYGVSFVIIAVNAAVYYSIKDRKNTLRYLTVAAGLLVVAFLYGQMTIRGKTATEVFSVCAVQANITPEEKLDPGLIDVVVDKQIDLSRKCLRRERSDLIIWPETAVTDDVIQDRILNQKIKSFIRESNVGILIGSALLIDERSFNSAVLFDKTGEVTGIYHKHHLLPFNEYFPWDSKLLFLRPLFKLNNYEFHRGIDVNTLYIKKESENVHFAPVICSEEGYSGLLRKQILRGATFIVAMLNDAWFRSDAAMVMHAQNGLMDAAMFKVPVIRSSNSGLTCAIDSYGRMGDRKNLRLGQPGVFYFDIYPVEGKTFYARHGNVFVFVCAIFVIMVGWSRLTFKSGRSFRHDQV